MGDHLLAKFAKVMGFEYNQPMTNDRKDKLAITTWLRNNTKVKGKI